MLHSTQGIVLRAVKYGETSLVVTVFTRIHGVQTYLAQGVRATSSKGRSGRGGLLQPASLLEIVAYHKPGQGMQRMREFNPLHLYQTVQEDVVKNSVALYSTELLLRLLPSDAPQPELFDFAMRYFISLDQTPGIAVGNFPLFFTAHCGRVMGYTISGSYTAETPYLDLTEGAYTADAPRMRPLITDGDARILDKILLAGSLKEVEAVRMDSETRFRLLDWYIEFLQRHTQHLGNIRSLPVLRAVLHG